MSKDRLTPSNQVDQKKLLDDKVKEQRENNFDNGHIRKTTLNGAKGQ